MSTYYCWHCYGESPAPAGICARCGRPVAAPPGTSYVDKLMWALEHPLVGRRMIAVKMLGLRREQRALPILRRLLSDEDPFLAAAALRSLVDILGADALHPDLLELAASGPAPVRRVAVRALEEPAPVGEE